MIWHIIKHFFTKIKPKTIHKGLFILFIIITAGTLGYSHFESETLGNGLWWSIVTITTVGYGDLFPSTPGGKILAILIMTTGIGILGAITAGFASFLLEKRIRELKGMKSLRLKDHFLICGWNTRGKDIITELKADKKCSCTDIIIIANTPQTPIEKTKGVFFIQGEINKETLEKANISKAKAALVLCDEAIDVYSRDAKAILSSLTIKKNNPSIFTSVELTDPQNMEQCKITGADEIVVAGSLTTNILVQSILDHGIPQCINELLTNSEGHEFYKIKVDKEFEGTTFSNILLEYKIKKEILIIGIESGKTGEIITNPSSDKIIDINDNLIVIAEERP